MRTTCRVGQHRQCGLVVLLHQVKKLIRRRIQIGIAEAIDFFHGGHALHTAANCTAAANESQLIFIGTGHHPVHIDLPGNKFPFSLHQPASKDSNLQSLADFNVSGQRLDGIQARVGAGGFEFALHDLGQRQRLVMVQIHVLQEWDIHLVESVLLELCFVLMGDISHGPTTGEAENQYEDGKAYIPEPTPGFVTHTFVRLIFKITGLQTDKPLLQIQVP